MNSFTRIFLILFAVMCSIVIMTVTSMAADKPNILVIWGDDIGTWNISHNNRGMMGYQTPNIDRIANEGVAFTDYYAQQSCTAGRAAFISGSVPVRSGMTKVGLPGAAARLAENRLSRWPRSSKARATPPASSARTTRATATNTCRRCTASTSSSATSTTSTPKRSPRTRIILATWCWPTARPSWKRSGRVACCTATPPTRMIRTEDPRFGKWGKQKCEDTGPLTKKRMETIDDETVAAAKDFITRQVKAGKPFFCWWNGTRMHFRTHVKEEHRGISGQDEYSDGMVEHDMHVGELLKLLDDLGIADNTIVHVLHRQRPALQHLARRRNHAVPQREELELGRRLPRARVRPLARSLPGRHDAQRHRRPRRLAADLCRRRRYPDIKEQLLKGTEINGRNYRNHIDGYNLLDYLSGKTDESPRNEFWYVNDDGQIVAARYDDWKVVFLENRGAGLRRLARAVRRAARAAALQPAPRSLREGPAQLEHLQRLVPRPSVCDRAHPGSGREVPHDHEGIPAEPVARLLQPQQDRGAVAECGRWQVVALS